VGSGESQTAGIVARTINFFCTHLEKVSENALAHRLQKKGLKVQQHPRKVYDEDGTVH